MAATHRQIHASSRHTKNNNNHPGVTVAGYALNKKRTLDKLVSACGRPVIGDLQIKDKNAVLAFSPAAFTIVQQAMHANYRVNDSKSTAKNIEYNMKLDKEGKIESEVYKIQELNKHSYTMNLYRTTSCLMVNGKNTLSKEIIQF
jgi:hypothetical protein